VHESVQCKIYKSAKNQHGNTKVIYYNITEVLHQTNPLQY